jgi:molybdenum cofactor guanylyltransferase
MPAKRLAVVQLEAFILVGGESSRMGTDKSRLLLGDQTFVERVAGALSAITDSISLVGARTDGLSSRFANVPDIHLKWGALGGLHAALSACHKDWAAVVACDLPFVSEHFFQRLASYVGESEAVVPIQKDNRPQPLCALYRIDPCLRLAEKLIVCGERRPRLLLESVQTCWVAFEKLADLRGSGQFFDNINTPEDYSRAKEKGATNQVVEMN